MTASKKEMEEFVDDLKGPAAISHWLLLIALVSATTFITWAYFAEIDEVTHAEGKVIPSQRIQVIQNLEGGIVKEILVNQGDIVNQGQILAYLNDIRFSADYKENVKKELALQLKIIRLEAQLDEIPYTVPDKIKRSLPELVRTEKKLYDSKLHEIAMLKNNQRLIQQEIDMTRPLLKSGAVSLVEILRLEQQLSENKGKTSSAISESLGKLNETKAAYAALKEDTIGLKDRLERTTIRSPVKGVVNEIHINTIGGVMKPGMDLMEIVPLDDTLLVEAKVKPRDIGFIHPGQIATVKITAYDFSIYGGLEGTVEHISADTKVNVIDQDEDPYYEIWVRTQKNHLGNKTAQLRIIPGMTSTVDILTGKKTIMDYILKPIMKARERAMRER